MSGRTQHSYTFGRYACRDTGSIGTGDAAIYHSGSERRDGAFDCLRGKGEFDRREDGIPGLEKIYGLFDWKSSKIYDNGLKYQVVENDEADVAPAYTTEGRLIETDKFVLLEDDQHMWPPYNIAPVVRNEVLEQYPEIAEILNDISSKLDTEVVTQLNAKVDIDQEEYEDVAAAYPLRPRAS